MAIPLSIFVSMLCVSFVPTTARFSDTEASEGNVFNAGTIDLLMDVTSERADIRTFVLSNESSAPFDYHVRVIPVSEPSFCENISISVGGGNKVALLSYTTSGFLGIGEEESLALEFAHGAPGGTPESVCSVNIVAEAMQLGGAHGSGFYDTEIRLVELSGADFGIESISSAPLEAFALPESLAESEMLPPPEKEVEETLREVVADEEAKEDGDTPLNEEGDELETDTSDGEVYE